jgi:hypothetical protein
VKPFVFWLVMAACAYTGARRRNLIAGLVVGALAGTFLEILWK